MKHYWVIHFCISIISYLSATLWDCVAPFENILVESNVSILRRRAAGAACETLLCYNLILLVTFPEVILSFSYLSATLWDCVAPFENLLVESNVSILRHRGFKKERV